MVVHTDLNITGKPAQFGRGVMVDVGNKLIGQFADCLAGKLSDADDAAAAEPDSAEPLMPWSSRAVDVGWFAVGSESVGADLAGSGLGRRRLTVGPTHPGRGRDRGR